MGEGVLVLVLVEVAVGVFVRVDVGVNPPSPGGLPLRISGDPRFRLTLIAAVTLIDRLKSPDRVNCDPDAAADDALLPPSTNAGKAMIRPSIKSRKSAIDRSLYLCAISHLN